MREIEFRAWDDTLMRMLPTRTLEDIAKSNFSSVNWYQLHIMQYTGLKDKKGVKIFEGDIVRYGKDVFEITWDQYFCRFYRKAASIGEYSMRQLFPLCEIQELELIGNIYENKDLI